MSTHALVVGGTGMLWAATLKLTESFGTVSVVARRAADLGARMHPLALDYTDAGALEAALRDAIAQFGPIALVVNWSTPEALAVTTRVLGEAGQPHRLFHVRGSRAADPARAGAPGLSPVPPHCLYREVILGWVDEGPATRWLTHAEISQGVLDAVASDAPRSIVGTVRPWERRPV